jgi:hypothetical protein
MEIVSLPVGGMITRIARLAEAAGDPARLAHLLGRKRTTRSPRITRKRSARRRRDDEAGRLQKACVVRRLNVDDVPQPEHLGGRGGAGRPISGRIASYDRQ